MASKIFDFVYAMFWMLLGAAIAVEQGLTSYFVGLGALTGLAFGHMIVMVVKAIMYYVGYGRDKED